MSNKHNIQANSLRSNDGESILVKDVKLTYGQGYAAADFDDNDLVNKYAATEIARSAAVRVPFSGATGMVINWQTDLADGVNTYAALFGNYVEARAYFNGGGTSDPTWTYSGSDVDVVTFDWGLAQDGWIKF